MTLLTAMWWKMMGKICDLMCTLPVGCDVWPSHQHEALIIGLCFPHSRHRPFETPLCSTAWRAPCQHCHLMLTIGEGIFCANFSIKQDNWTPCLRAWHGKCYCTTDNGEFPIARAQDREGEFMIQDAKDEKWFLEARDGDNLVTPFHCDR